MINFYRICYIRDFFNDKREKFDCNNYFEIYDFHTFSFEVANNVWKKDDQEKINCKVKLSRKFSGAVAMSLCAIFFCSIPHPYSLEVGVGMLGCSLPIIYNEVCEALEKQSEEQRKLQIIEDKKLRRRVEERSCSQCPKNAETVLIVEKDKVGKYIFKFSPEFDS